MEFHKGLSESRGQALLALEGHGCQMAIVIFLDRMCLALRASGRWLRYAAKFDPFLSFDCARVEGMGDARKGRDQILPSGNLVEGRWRRGRSRDAISRQMDGQAAKMMMVMIIDRFSLG